MDGGNNAVVVIGSAARRERIAGLCRGSGNDEDEEQDSTAAAAAAACAGVCGCCCCNATMLLLYDHRTSAVPHVYPTRTATGTVQEIMFDAARRFSFVPCTCTTSARASAAPKRTRCPEHTVSHNDPYKCDACTLAKPADAVSRHVKMI
jgi:hypothetical protein